MRLTGAAYYIGYYTAKETLKELLQRAAGDAGIFHEGMPESPLILRSGENAAGKKVHYLLYYAEEERCIACPYEKVMDLLTGETYCRREEIRLTARDVKILEERNSEDME